MSDLCWKRKTRMWGKVECCFNQFILQDMNYGFTPRPFITSDRAIHLSEVLITINLLTLLTRDVDCFIRCLSLSDSLCITLQPQITIRSHLHFKPKFTSRILKNFKKLPPVGFELTTLTITGSNVECLSIYPQSHVLLGRPLIEVFFHAPFQY